MIPMMKEMNKADWLTAVAAMLGVIGIGLGYWWADAVAALFISLDIVKDGYTQTKDAVTGLINRKPKELDGSYNGLSDTIRERLEALPWVHKASARLREEGHLFFGEGFITPAHNSDMTLDNIQKAIDDIHDLDWRLQSFVITFVPGKDLEGKKEAR
jgi:divalent metal cation (Fe/Co/Zn/Cd) transporter